ncbi:MAG: hypothetical protein H7836_01585 [Magnetococcus sp. YQC-3]
MNMSMLTIKSVNRPKMDVNGVAQGRLTAIENLPNRDDRIRFDMEVMGTRGIIPAGSSDTSFVTSTYIDPCLGPEGDHNAFTTLLLNWGLLTEEELRSGTWDEEKILTNLEAMIGTVFSLEYETTYLEETLSGKLVPIKTRDAAQRKDKVKVGNSIIVSSVIPIPLMPVVG